MHIIQEYSILENFLYEKRSLNPCTGYIREIESLKRMLSNKVSLLLRLQRQFFLFNIEYRSETSFEKPENFPVKVAYHFS